MKGLSGMKVIVALLVVAIVLTTSAVVTKTVGGNFETLILGFTATMFAVILTVQLNILDDLEKIKEHSTTLRNICRSR